MMQQNAGGDVHLTLAPIFQHEFRCWEELEKALASAPNSGAAFEQFVSFFLLFFRDVYQVKNLYCPEAGIPIPLVVQQHLRLEGRDHGVDGTWITHNNQHIAFQCKFRGHRTAPTGTELSTFWAEAEYADSRYTITNAAALPRVAGKKKSHQAILVDSFDSLPPVFFKALVDYARTTKIQRPERVKPRDYQVPIIENTLLQLKATPRGKIIAACGTGKTLLGLWITEQTSNGYALFLAPNLTLIRQTLQKWEINAQSPFEFICVCSDETVVSDAKADEIAIRFSDLDIPVTTTAQDVRVFLQSPKRRGKFRMLFSTYQSLDVIATAVKMVPRFKFDLIIFDEAHRTVGLEGKNNFSLGLSDTKIPAKRRIFMTATERLIRPRIKKHLKENKQVIFSMDDKKVYGPIFSKLSFGDAIKKRIISDYRIVLAGALEKEAFHLVSGNKHIALPGLQEPVPAELVFQRALLHRAINELGIRKIITYHSSVKRAKQFAKLMNLLDLPPKTFIGHVNGNQNSSERYAIFRTFETADLGIITNVRCLAEGVDIPYIDSVFFSDPKNSLIDIVQAIGRALRQPYGEEGKIANIIIPVLINDTDAANASVNEDRFEGAFSAIQAMREQDESLAEWIDALNLSVVRGAARRTSPGKLKLLMPTSIDLDRFNESLTLKIADVNRNPSSYVGMGSKLGKGERVSAYSRIFQSLGDYNPKPYHDSCVAPTLAKFNAASDLRTPTELQVNNNNVSHTRRLGLITADGNKRFSLTKLGRLLWGKKVSFDHIFKNQMMLFSINVRGHRMFPYRMAFQALSRIGQMNYIEFLYGIYSIQPEMDEETALAFVVNKVTNIRDTFPHLEFTSAKHQNAVRAELNRDHPFAFSDREVWTDRTTHGNQFRYFANHLALFSNLFKMNWDYKILEVRRNAQAEILQVLKDSTPPRNDYETAYGNWLWLN